MKYHNIKITIDGIKFDSKAEANRYIELKMLLKAGKISDLNMQPVFQLQEKFTDRQGVKHGAITYRADFNYLDSNGNCVTEDVKGMLTPVYKLKKKLLLNKYKGLDFREIK